MLNVYLETTKREQRREQTEAKGAADREATRARIEKQARLDALDFMKQRQGPDRVFSDFTIKELLVSYLGDTIGSFEFGDRYGYRADMVVSIRSNIAVVQNVTTHRLKLRYDPVGTFMPNISEVTDVSNIDLDSPLLKR